MQQDIARTRTWPRWKIGFGVFLLVPALIWAVLWFVAQRKIDAELAKVVVRANAAGHVLECPVKADSGFPFALAKVCDAPSLKTGTVISAKAAQVSGRWSVFSPDSTTVAVQAPFDAQAMGASVHGEWANAETQFGGLLSKSLATTFTVSKANVTLQAAAANYALQFDRFLVSAKPGVLQPTNNKLPVEMALLGLKNAEFAKLLGTTEPIDLKFNGIVDHLDLVQGKTLPLVLERWREQSGLFTIDTVSLEAGVLKLQAHGSLSLDVQHRVQGTLDAEVSGADGLLSNFGVGPKSGILGGMLSGMLKGKTENGVTKGAQIPLRFAEGKVFLGPIPLPVVLVPLY